MEEKIDIKYIRDMRNNNVWSASGYAPGPINSYVGKGESIINFDRGEASLVRKGTVGKDNQPSSVADGDEHTILGNKIDVLGHLYGETPKPMTFAQQAAPITEQVEKLNSYTKMPKKPELSSLSKRTYELQWKEVEKAKAPLMASLKRISDRQEQQNEIQNNKPAYDEGKPSNSVTEIPWYTRAIPAIAGIGAGLAQLAHWGNNKITYHNTYAPNQNEVAALRGLASLRDNPYSKLATAREEEGQGRYRLAQAGGLTAGQKYKQALGLNLASQKLRAGLIDESQKTNIGLKQKLYGAMLESGNQNATRKQNADQHDWADYVAAHGRKTKGIETAMSNILNQLNSTWSNEFKYRTWRDTANMYNAKLTADQEALLNDIQQRQEALRAQMYANGYVPSGKGWAPRTQTTSTLLPTPSIWSFPTSSIWSPTFYKNYSLTMPGVSKDTEPLS